MDFFKKRNLDTEPQAKMTKKVPCANLKVL